MRDATDIVVLLDRSGSMANIKTDMEGGYQTYLDGLRAQAGEATVSLYQFDAQDLSWNMADTTWFETVYENVPLAVAPALTLLPRGGTALLDAMSRAIELTGARLRALPEHLRPNRVLFVTITDGEENSSRYTTTEVLRQRIEQQSTVYKWAFIYLGADHNSFAQAGAIGIPVRNTANYVKTAGGVRGMFAGAICSTNNYRSTGNSALPTDPDGNLPEQQP